MPTQIEKVQRYYDATVLDYSLLWTGRRDLAMHFGYYDQADISHSEALLRMNAHLAARVHVTQDDRVLDAGCGYGGSALWLAENFGCKVVGLNIVPYQLAKARAHAKKRGLDRLVTFVEANYEHTGLPSDSFTVVWGLESIVHAADKTAFTSEMFRLLQNKGRIVISEYMLRENPTLSKEEVNFVQPWLDGWAMPHLLTPGEHERILVSAGFHSIQIEDATDHVRPSLQRLATFVPLGLPVGRFLSRMHLISPTHMGNVSATQRQMEALDRGLWRYTIITAEK